MDENEFVPENVPEPEKVIRISRKILVILAIVLLVVLFVGWGVVNLLTSSTGLSEDVYYVPSVVAVPTSGGGMSDSAERYSPPYNNYNQQPDITDTREFLKTSYSALVYTRDVHEVVETVEEAVREVDGRVDGTQSTERNGRVNFTIAKSNLAEFRAEIEDITSAKLYTENISSQNMLAQKQGIEERTTNAVKSLTDLEAEKAELDKVHEERAQQLQSQITGFQQRLNTVRQDILTLEAEGSGTSSIAIARRSEEATLAGQVTSYQNALSNENRTYSSNNASLVRQINAAGGNLEEVIDQDVDFTNNIETVSGYVQVSWISYWDIGNRFSPTPMLLNVIVIFFIVYWVLRRKKITPRIELV